MTDTEKLAALKAMVGDSDTDEVKFSQRRTRMTIL